MLPLDQWNINYLSESNLLNIMSHSLGFVYLSMKYIPVESTAINALQNSLMYATKLVHLDLSGVPITSIGFLLVEPLPPLHKLILDACRELDISQYYNLIAVVEKLKKLEILSLNGMTSSTSFLSSSVSP